MSQVRVLVMSGSLRAASINTRLAACAGTALQEQGCEVDAVQMADFRLPVYDGDLEAAEGVPTAAVQLRERFKAADALLFCSPEYNGSVPGAFKNLLDWLSRPVGEESGLLPFKNKPVAIMASSPGALGGLRSLNHLRAVLSHVGCLVIPDQFGLPKGDQAFDDDGLLLEARHQKRVQAVTERLATVARALKA